MDLLGTFLNECCEIKPFLQVKTSDLFNAFVVWSGDKNLKQNKFGRDLSERGFPLLRKTWRQGLGLLQEDSLN
jgi:hypothetical protein